jgi:FOG: CheY-like receiver
MSIVREGVESRGGSITIHSEPQKGTVFMIHMPTNLAAPQDTAPRQSQPETISPPHIEVLRDVPVKVPKNDISVLIVDDSAVMRQTMSKVVERAGWKAFSATEGGEALQFLKKAQALPDIIITDLEMPGLGGMGFIEALKCNPQLFDIPVIMVTSRNERVHREKAFALGAAKFLTKPIESGELKSIINSLCVVKN